MKSKLLMIPLANNRLTKIPLRLKIGLLLAVLLAPTAKAKEAPLFENWLPSDTLVLLKVHAIDELNTKLKEHPIQTIIKNDTVQKFFAPLIERMENKGLLDYFFGQNWEFERQRIAKNFAGQAGLVFFKGSDPNAEGTKKARMAFVAEYQGERELLEKLMEKNETKQATEAFLNETLYYTQGPTEAVTKSAWALVDGTLLVASSVEVLRELIPRIKDPWDSPSLIENRVFEEAVDKAGNNDLFLFFNLRSLIPEFLDTLEVTEGSEPLFNFFGITPQAIINAMALEVLESSFLSINFDNKETRLYGGLLYTEERGLTNLFSLKKGALPPPGFTPTDVHSATLSNFDVEQTFENLEAIFAEISPLFANIYQIQLEQFKINTGLDFKENVIRNIDNPHGSYAVYSIDENKTYGPEATTRIGKLFFFPLRDPKGMEVTIEAIKDTIAPGRKLFDERDYLGTKIFVLKEAFEQKEPGDTPSETAAYAIAERYLFLSSGPSTALLEEALSKLKKSGKNLWTEPEIEDALKRLPEDPVEYGFYNFGILLDLLFSNIAKAQRHSFTDFDLCDPNALPQKNLFPSILVLGTYKDAQSLTLRSIIVKQEGEAK